MLVLVTGATGFLGSHVAERLVQQGAQVRVLTRGRSRLTYLDGLEAERVEGDLRDHESLARAVQGVDIVVHAAGLTMGAALSEAEFHEVNALATGRLAKAAREAGVRRFVYVSSQAAQGPNHDGSSRAPDPPRPISAYGRSKLAGEYAALAERDPMSVAVLRPPVIYGERDRALLPLYRLAKLGIVPVYGSGKNRISVVHVQDAAEAIAAAALAPGPSGAVYTFSDGATHTWETLVEAFGRAYGRVPRLLRVPPALYAGAGLLAAVAQAALRRPLPLSPDQVRHMHAPAWLADNEAITRELGWKPLIDVREGFERTVRWYRQQGWL
ncbi:MAG TPA: SDR family NAD(P)-dependent oxidoreductase [Dehalococcoidia bacterium]|nr:SDR family NAD(P)-dependent oxidoreductase [Dehalococcoidia bacterium]